MYIQESNIMIKYTQNMGNYNFSLYLLADKYTVNTSTEISPVYHILTDWKLMSFIDNSRLYSTFT